MRSSSMMTCRNRPVAYRQMSLLLRRPPGREAYPGDVFLPPLAPAGAFGQAERGLRGRFADRAADHRDAGWRRVGLHSDQRDLDHRRPDLPRDGTVLPGHPPGREHWSVGVARGFLGADQRDEVGRGQGEAGTGAVREMAAFAQFGSDLDASTPAAAEPRSAPDRADETAAILAADQCRDRLRDLRRHQRLSRQDCRQGRGRFEAGLLKHLRTKGKALLDDITNNDRKVAGDSRRRSGQSSTPSRKTSPEGGAGR